MNDESPTSFLRSAHDPNIELNPNYEIDTDTESMVSSSSSTTLRTTSKHRLPDPRLLNDYNICVIRRHATRDKISLCDHFYQYGLAEIALVHLALSDEEDNSSRAPLESATQLSFDKLLRWAKPYWPGKPFDDRSEELWVPGTKLDMWNEVFDEDSLQEAVLDHWRHNRYSLKKKEFKLFVLARRERMRRDKARFVPSFYGVSRS